MSEFSTNELVGAIRRWRRSLGVGGSRRGRRACRALLRAPREVAQLARARYPGPGPTSSRASVVMDVLEKWEVIL